MASLTNQAAPRKPRNLNAQFHRQAQAFAEMEPALQASAFVTPEQPHHHGHTWPRVATRGARRALDFEGAEQHPLLPAFDGGVAAQQ